MWPLGLSGFDVTRNTRALQKLERLESIYSKSIAESFEMALLSNTVVQRDVLGRSDGHGGVGINVRCCPTDGISDACAHQINSPKKTRQRSYLQKMLRATSYDGLCLCFCLMVAGCALS
jgi:hypothetical protein